MALEVNQFELEPVVGSLDMQVPGTVITCQVGSGQSTALVPGQAVKLSDVAGGPPRVVATAADADKTFGFVSRNWKDATYKANEFVEIALLNSVMWMEAGGAIARGASVENDVSEIKVITAAGTNPKFGIALDKAAASGDLIRVLILTPAV